MKTKIIILGISLFSFFTITNAQGTKITFADMLSFSSTVDFPADVFSCMEKKGLTFSQKENYNDLFKSAVADQHIDLSNCNRYYYSGKKCTVIISFCEKLVRDKMMECTRMITIGAELPEYFDSLVDKIKSNCVYSKTEDSQYNNIPVKTFYYNHKSGAVFSFKKYLGDNNKMEYYIVVKI